MERRSDSVADPNNFYLHSDSDPQNFYPDLIQYRKSVFLTQSIISLIGTGKAYEHFM
jgi:hypothetical protein